MDIISEKNRFLGSDSMFDGYEESSKIQAYACTRKELKILENHIH